MLQLFTKWDKQQFTPAVNYTAITASGNTNSIAINKQSLPAGMLNTSFCTLGVVAKVETPTGTTPTLAMVPVVQDSPDGVTWTNQADAEVLPANLLPGAATPYTINGAGTWQFSIRYKGVNQYVRVQFQAVVGGTTPSYGLTAVFALDEPNNIY